MLGVGNRLSMCTQVTLNLPVYTHAVTCTLSPAPERFTYLYDPSPRILGLAPSTKYRVLHLETGRNVLVTSSGLLLGWLPNGVASRILCHLQTWHVSPLRCSHIHKADHDDRPVDLFVPCFAFTTSPSGMCTTSFCPWEVLFCAVSCLISMNIICNDILFVSRINYCI